MRWYGYLMQLCGAIAAVSLAAVVAVVLAEIVGRNSGLWSIGWSVELSEYALLITTFIGAPWLLERNGHVAVDLLRNLLGRRAEPWQPFLINFLGMTISGVVAWYSVDSLLTLHARGAMIVKELVFPEWWTMLPVAICFVLLCLGFAQRLLSATNGVLEEY